MPAVTLPVRRWRRRRRGRPQPDRVQHLAVLTLALLGLILLLATSAAVIAGQQRHFFIPMIGVTGAWTWVLALPWLLLAVTPVAVYRMRTGRTGEPVPRVRRWSALAGVTLLLVLWAFNLLA